MDGRTNKSPPVFYRTLSPSGPLPKKKERKKERNKANTYKSRARLVILVTQCWETMSRHNVGTQCRDTKLGHNVGTQCRDTMSGHNVGTQCRDNVGTQWCYTMFPNFVSRHCVPTL